MVTRELRLEGAIGRGELGICSELVAEPKVVALPTRALLAHMHMDGPRFACGWAEEAVIWLTLSKYQPQRLESRAVARFLGHVGHRYL